MSFKEPINSCIQSESSANFTIIRTGIFELFAIIYNKFFFEQIINSLTQNVWKASIKNFEVECKNKLHCSVSNKLYNR